MKIKTWDYRQFNPEDFAFFSGDAEYEDTVFVTITEHKTASQLHSKFDLEITVNGTTVFLIKNINELNGTGWRLEE